MDDDSDGNLSLTEFKAHISTLFPDLEEPDLV